MCSLYGQIMQICLTKCNCFHACIAHRSVAAAARGSASAPDSGCCVSAAAASLLLLPRLRPGLEKSNGNFTIFPCSHTCACLVPGLDQIAPFFWSSPSFLIFHARENERALVVSGPRDWVACQDAGVGGWVCKQCAIYCSHSLSLCLCLSLPSLTHRINSSVRIRNGYGASLELRLCGAGGVRREGVGAFLGAPVHDEGFRVLDLPEIIMKCMKCCYV